MGCYHPPSLAPVRWHDSSATKPEAPAQTLDEDAAIAYADAHADAILAHRGDEAIANARIDAAGVLTNPELHVGRRANDGVTENDRSVIAIRVHPDQPWTRSARIAGAEADAKVAQAETKIALRALHVEIRAHYAALAFARDELALLGRQREVGAKRRAIVEARVTASTATRIDLALIDRDLAELDIARADAELTASTARTELAALVGASIEPAVGALAVDDKVPELGTPPEIELLDQQIAAADAHVYEARTRRIPWIESLQLQRALENGTADYAISASISLPIFGTSAVAHAELDRARAVREATIARLDAERRAALDRLAAQTKHVHDIEAALAPLRTTPEALDPIDALRIEERALHLERTLVEAKYRHRLARIAVDAWR